MDTEPTARQAYETLMSPLRVGTRQLRNRIIMGSMHTRLEAEADAVRKQARFYVERARGEAALIITGGFAPNEAGLMEPGGPRIDDRDRAMTLRPICDAVQAEGGLICAQILHSGRYARHDNGVAPSPIRSPINPRVPRQMTSAEVWQTVEDYAEASANAQAAGFDGVEIMGSEGYLINQFTVVHSNRRDDDWGGCAENRHRLAINIVRLVRERCGPEFLIIYRISAADLVEGGAPAEEIVALARKVEAAGADMLNTGIGWHEARVPTIAYPVPRGVWREAAGQMKRAVAIPVVASNRINTPDVAEDILRAGHADLVSLARPMLADPHFARKTRLGRAGDINTCIACNQACLDFIFSERTASCLVNPRACRETEFRDTPVETPKRIAVVGGGAAGMAAASEAASLGHAVTLFETADRLGGQLNLARAAPGKAEFEETLRYYRHQLQANGVDVRLGSKADADDLATEFDHVIIATGVTPRIPGIAGIDHPSVTTYDAILSGRRIAGERVAILGAGGIGFDVAEFLVSRPGAAVKPADFFRTWSVDASFTAPGALTGNPLAGVPGARQVTMLQRKTTKPGVSLGVSTGWILRNALRKHGVEVLAGVTYERIDDAGLHIFLDGEARLLEIDTIVLCTGQEPERGLYEALRERGVPATMIGGAKEATELDALRAIDEGVRLAQAM
jgi:2,4-dienoyl-CoA reductase (NADPH2)